MFDKKRKIREYRFQYGKSPSLTKRDFRQTRHSSRFLTKKTHPFFSKIKKFSISIITVLIVIGGIYLFFLSGFFNIKLIKVSDELLENTALAEKIESQTTEAINKNILFIDPKELEKKILQQFPEIEKITIEKNLPRTITIKFTEYPLVANVINESNVMKKSYIINTIGYVIKEDSQKPDLPYIRIKSDEPLNPKSPIIEESKLKYMLDTIVYFEDKFGMRIIEIVYKKIPKEIHLLIEKNFYIWLDIQKSSEEQLKKLKKALVTLDIYNENFEYIDLRIAGGNGDKIIYKRR